MLLVYAVYYVLCIMYGCVLCIIFVSPIDLFYAHIVVGPYWKVYKLVA